MTKCGCNAHSLLTTFAGDQTYAQKVLATGPIAYWIQGEAAGAVSLDEVLPPLQNGAYTGVTLGQPGSHGNTSPFFDGANDFNNVLTATLQGRYDGSEGTVMAWVRVANVGVWTDGAVRMCVAFGVDANNFLQIRRDNVNNQIGFYYRAGGVGPTLSITTLLAGGRVDWMQLALTFSQSGVGMRSYLDGAQIGLPQAIPAPWVGVLLTALIGASSVVPAFVLHGYTDNVALWDRPLTPDEIAALAVV